MLTFIDHRQNEYGAQVTYKVTNSVNGERSVSGTIYTNDQVLHGIDRGWRFRLDDEYYVITFAKPRDSGKQVYVEFDAVHQFFWDFSKSAVHRSIGDGSHRWEEYLKFIFEGSGYSYENNVTVKAFRKESFGYKNRLSLFYDVIKKAGAEFVVHGRVVRILERVGSDLSTVVRKNFNMDELKIEKNINGFFTFQKGFGAWKDVEDHSKGRLEAEYRSPLAAEYGVIEGEPVVDERYTRVEEMKERLKENVDNSYTISVQLDMEDLTNAGYRYEQPRAGDYIMAINDNLGFRERIRIVSYTSEYDVRGRLVSHKVTCNDIGSVKKEASNNATLSAKLGQAQAYAVEAMKQSMQALTTADGKNTVFYGSEFPTDEPQGTLIRGDILYYRNGEKTDLYIWNGAEWEKQSLGVPEGFQEEIDSIHTEIEAVDARLTQANAEQERARQALLEKANANTALAETAQRGSEEAKASAARALSQAVQAKSEAVAEAQRLVGESSNQLSHQLETVSAELSQTKDSIRLKADRTAVEAVKSTAEDAQAVATENARNISRTQAELMVASEAIAQKVSRTDLNPLTQRLTTAEATIRTQAGQIEQRLTRTEVESLVTGKGYVTSLVMENKVRETATSFERKITETRNLIPNSVSHRNLMAGTSDKWNAFQTITSNNNWLTSLGWVRFGDVSGIYAGSKVHLYVHVSADDIVLDSSMSNHTMTLQGPILDAAGNPTWTSWNLYHPFSGRWSKNLSAGNNYHLIRLTATVTPELYRQSKGFELQFRIDGVRTGKFHWRALMVSTGDLAPDYWAEAPEDVETKLHEVKDTVASHSRTIAEQGRSISQVVQTAEGLVTRVENLKVGSRNYALGTVKPAKQNSWIYRLSPEAHSWQTTQPLFLSFEYQVSNSVKAFRVNRVVKFKDGTADQWDYTTNNVALGRESIDTNQKRSGSYSQPFEWKALRNGKTSNDIKEIVFHINLESGSQGDVMLSRFKVEKGTIATDWSPAPEDGEEALASTKTEVRALAGSYAIQNLTSAGQVVSQINATGNSILLDASKIRLKGKTLADEIIAMDGKFNKLFVADGTFSKLNAGIIGANSITADKIVVNSQLAQKIVADRGVLNTLLAKEVISSYVQAVDLTANQIKSGTLSALNGAMKIDLNKARIDFIKEATIEFSSANNAVVRRKGTHTAFIHFNDVPASEDGGVGSLYTSIGVTSSGDGVNSASEGRFAGIRCYRGSRGHSHNATVDKIEVIGDKVILKDGVTANRGFIFDTASMDQGEYFNMVQVVRGLIAMWEHFKNGMTQDMVRNRSNASVNKSLNMLGIR